jgi:hypothetical protein
MGKTVWRGAGLLLAGAFMLALASFGSQARADTINFYLNQFECTDGPCNVIPPVIADALSVKVTVTLVDSTHATVLLQAPSGNIDLPIWVKVNAPGFTSWSATATTALVGHGTTGSEDHFGTFNLGTGASDTPSVTFSLTALLGWTWASAAVVLAPTTDEDSSYGHGFMVATAAQYAGYYNPNQGTPGDTPLPAALPLFASGLGALGVLGWRRKRKAQAA